MTKINYTVEELKSGKLDATISEPAIVGGQVMLDSTRTPIGKVKLRVSSSNGENRILSTDENGEFKCKVTAGKISIELNDAVRGYHFVRDEQDVATGELARIVKDFFVKPGEHKQIEPFLLERLRPINVKVVDQDSEPVSGAKIELFSPGKHANYDTNADSATTALDGSATVAPWSKPRSGTIVVATFKREGKSMIGESFVDGGSEVTEIKLLPAANARGKVTLNGKPLAGVSLRLSISVPKTHFPGLHPQRSVSRTLPPAISDENGEYSIDVPQVDAHGYPAILHVGVRPRGNSAIPNVDSGGISHRMDVTGLVYSRDIEFTEGPGEILGRVIDDSGKGVAGVAVYIARSFDNPRNRNLRYRLFQPSTVYTGNEGKFRFMGLPESGSFEIKTSGRDRLDYQKSYTQDSAAVEVGQKDVLFKIRQIGTD